MRIIREGFLSTSQAVAQHLPYLRRYARALAGSQQAGDAYVAETLEAVVQDPKVLETGASTRIALYQLFTKVWNSVSLNAKPGAPAELKQPVERHLAQIAPLPRQAFLLVALEGLSEDDAAKVLDVDVPKLRELVEDSGRELAAEIATDVLPTFGFTPDDIAVTRSMPGMTVIAPGDEIETRLRDEFGIEDAAPILDGILGPG